VGARTRICLLLGALGLLALGAVAADAELVQEDGVIASFEGEISPNRLPRSAPAPVSVRVGGNVKTTEGVRLPQLRKIAVAINRAGKLYDNGLPTCKVSTIQPATEQVAKQRCGDSIVGDGHVTLVVRLPSQADYISRNNLLAFNGPTRKGKKLILAQVYSKNPPGAIILTFTVNKHPGVYGNVIETTLPKYAENWAYLTQFEMTLGRTYRWHGKQRSFISASCAAPAGLNGVLFPFGKATYSFAGGLVLSTKINRTCNVAGE
jgi:hypothetical protein